MAAFGIESGTAFGRGFDASGFCGLFKAWVVKTPANHGPGWYIWLDRSSDPTDPFIVVTDQAAPTPNSKAKFVALALVTANAGQVRFSYYMYYDNVTNIGVGLRHRAWLGTVDAGSFAYYFRGGPETLAVFTRNGSSFWRTYVTEFEGIWDGVDNLLEPETASGVTTNPLFLETDPGGYLSGYWGLTGYKPLLDVNGRLYFSIVLVSGSTYNIQIFSDAARTNRVGFTSNFTNTSTGAKTVTQDNSSGLGGTITTDITVAAANNIECRFLRVDLQSGQAANFTPDNYYFLVDFTGGTGKVVYLKVENVVGDQLIVDYAGTVQVPSGAIISPYPHRWYFNSSDYGTSLSSGFSNSTLPYHSVQGGEMQTNSFSSNDQRADSDWMSNVITRSNPNDKLRYGMMRPWIGESQQTASSGGATGNRFYGKAKNIYVTAPGSLSILQDQRVLNGVGYLAYFVSAGSYALCIRNTESLS